jgi:hypothetical protein
MNAISALPCSDKIALLSSSITHQSGVLANNQCLQSLKWSMLTRGRDEW